MNLSTKESEVNELSECLQGFNNCIGQYERNEISEDRYLSELTSIEDIDFSKENMFNQMLGYSVLAGAYRALKIKHLSYANAYYDNKYVYKEISYLHNVQYVITRVTKEQWAALYVTAIRTACYTYYTLANTYDHIGRFNEAQQYYRMAMMDPNLSYDIEVGQGFSFANMHVFWTEEEPWIVRKAKQIITKYPKEFETFPELKWLKTAKTPLFEPPHFKYPETEEGVFRHWINENYLRLNRYVDVEPHSKLSQADNVKLPFVWDDKRELYQSSFEEIKSMYIGTLKIMYDTFGKEFSILNTELLKMAYKNFYSILDKVSMILATYIGLPMKVHEIDFKNIWYDKKRKSLRPEIISKSQNLSLLALYNVQNDIYGSPIEGFVPDEQTKNLHRIRNFIEHKHVVIVDEPMSYDDYQLRISKHELSIDAIRLAQLVRCSIIYLCNFMMHEEFDRHGEVNMRNNSTCNLA